jgi:hypothetical protein
MKFLLLFIPGLFYFITSFSQSINNDSLTDLQQENVINLYNRYTDGNAPIYNGSEYIDFTSKLEGDPFFAANDNPYGWISFEGIKYQPLLMQYDITRDEVVILFPDSISRVVLHNEFIDSFYLARHTFIRLKENQEQNLANTGFYDLLYNGKVRLFARRVKTMEDDIKSNVAGKVFFISNRYYLFRNGLYYLIDNKKDVFRFMGDKSHQIKLLMRQDHLKFHRIDFESVLTKVIALYDQIIR